MNREPGVSKAIERSRQETEQWLCRIRAEIDCAGRLARRNASDHPEWADLVKLAEERLVSALSEGGVDLAGVVTDIEARLAPLAPALKAYTMHCVGHAHIDMNWMWSWPETVAVTNDTFATVLTLMDEYPEFCFSHSFLWYTSA